MKHALVFFLAIFCIPLLADDWGDLENSTEMDKRDMAINALPFGFRADRGSFGFHFLYLVRYQDQKKFRSQAFLPFLYRAQSKIDGRKRALFAPFYYTETGPRSSTLATPVVFSYTESSGELADRSIFACPFFVRSRSRSGLEGNLAQSETFWAPVAPLVYHHSDGAGSRNVVLLADWESNERGLSHFWVYPIAGWKRDSYAGVFPLFLHLQNKDNQTSVTYSPVYYASRGGTRETTIAGPYIDSRTKESSVSALLPAYFSYASSDFTLDLLFPWHLKVETPDSKIYVHVTGAASTVAQVRFGTEKNLYVDADISWLYNAFNFSTRVPLGTSTADLAPADGTLSRENSRAYAGYSALYGLIAYEAADTRRHFRFLPLSWLSWDTRNEDGTIVVPVAFAYSSSTDSSYLAIFPALVPLYGRQTSARTMKEAYLGGAFIRETDEARSRNEYTVLWPLINVYNSPEESGFRAVPFVWHQSKTQGAVTTSYTLSTLYFSKKVETETESHEFNTIFPVYFETTETKSAALLQNGEPGSVERAESKQIHGNLLGLVDYKTGPESRLWILPVFFAGENYSSLLPVYYYKKDKEDSLLVSPLALAIQSETEQTVLSPVYMNFEEDGEGMELGAFGAGWFRYHNESTGEDLKLAGLGLVYMSSEIENRTYEGSLFGVLWSLEQDTERDTSRFALLEGVYARSVEAGEVTHSFFGLSI